jgi:hypothetical protein
MTVRTGVWYALPQFGQVMGMALVSGMGTFRNA